MSLVYQLPTPAAINFQHLLDDPTGQRTSQLSCANDARSSMRMALKECRQDPKRQDWLKIIKVIEGYLPHLLGLMTAVQTDRLLLSNEIIFSWRPTLSSRRVRTGPRISLPSFQYELVCVLFTLALALSNHSNFVVSSLGSYEFGSDASRRSGDEKLNLAVDGLCRASGLLEFLSRETIPDWEKTHPDGAAQLRSCRPPELSREVTSSLSRVALADAERLAIRRLLSKSAMDRHTTPGAGLPKSHPSPALLAKLELNVYQLYCDAINGFNLAIGVGELLGNLRDNATQARHFALGRGYKWLAVEAGELINRPSEAISWLGLARKEIKGLNNGPGSIIRNGFLKNERSFWKEKVEHELEEIDTFLKGYEQLNRTVTFEPIPSPTSLLARVPGGRPALCPKKYSLPSPLTNDFVSVGGSGNVDWADSDDEELANPGLNTAAYALKGSYY
ncbi:hypothetical protein O181_058065 [Austropuccinia psidii MF-1]|uniref:pH-response regulator protein palC n=1 Tax=Austropuccinia psidii MF-1 TaxID=1389203 RepID=A0A9Q3HXI7_9BASI|nr:hypothetical protein [Austropuccinia psidii MF-1]